MDFRSPNPVLTPLPKITAIMVDGGFFLKRVRKYQPDITPSKCAEILARYCQWHLAKQAANLYRIFYYDCPPSSRTVYHPLLRTNIDLKKSATYTWMTEFHQELRTKRKLAVRLGEELATSEGYILRARPAKRLCAGTIGINDLTDADFRLAINQKGVDMRLGLDIAQLALKGQVNQIIMISADSDFVPAAKLARREGIDFVIDPMYADIAPSLAEHVDGVSSQFKKLMSWLHNEE